MKEEGEEFRGLSRARIDVIVGVKQASPQKGEPRGKTQHQRSLLSRAAIGRLKTQTNAVWETRAVKIWEMVDLAADARSH